MWGDNNSRYTPIAGCCHGTDGISGDEVVLAEGRETFLHDSYKIIDGIFLIPSAQRHTLHTNTHRSGFNS